MKQIVSNEPIAGEVMSPAKIQVAATAFLTLFSLVGLSFYGLPFFYNFWKAEFGWTHWQVTSGNFFGKALVGPLFGFIAGWMIDRFGPRRLMLTGIILGGIAVMGLSQMTSLWMFYMFYVSNALGYVCGGPLPNQVLLSRWFDKARGKAMGFAYIGIGVGGTLVPLVAAALIQRMGWRQALLTLGALMILIAFPMAWFVKESPGDMYENKSAAIPVPIRDILKSRAFYLLAIGSMCSIGAVGGMNHHLKLFLANDLKYPEFSAAKIISLVLASSVIGRLLMGWLADRFQKKYVMLLIYALVSAPIPALYCASAPVVFYIFAVAFGIAFGVDYMIIPLMAADLFGVKVLGRIMGIILTADGLAEALVPVLVGYTRDISQSYANGFTVLIAFAVAGAIAIAMLPREPLVDMESK